MNQDTPYPSKIALIGAPSSAGGRLVGQEQAPRALREAGLIQSLKTNGHEVNDLGDITEVSFTPDTQHPKQQNLVRVISVLEQVAKQVGAAVTDKKWPLIIGGDCTITIGVLAALSKHYPSLGLIYIDGDVDLNTPETTFTGILDGRNIALFGYSTQAGGIDPVETELLKVTTMDKYPLEKVTDAAGEAAISALRSLESKVDHILIHFDVDVIDHDDFPAADVPHHPGLKLEQVQEALNIFLKSDKSVGLVVTEFNASRDSDGTLARQLVDLIQTAKG